MAIATLEELKAIVGVEHPFDDAWLTLALEGGVAAVNWYCKRTFDTVADTATDRVYVPTDEDCLYVDDFGSTSGLVVSNYGTTMTSYQLEPLNQLGDDRSYRPYNKIVLLSGCWSKGLTDDHASITITAKWGWTGGCPSPVKAAVLQVAKRISEQPSFTGGSTAVTEFGSVTISEDNNLKAMLAPYRRWDRVGIK